MNFKSFCPLLTFILCLFVIPYAYAQEKPYISVEDVLGNDSETYRDSGLKLESDSVENILEDKTATRIDSHDSSPLESQYHPYLKSDLSQFGYDSLKKYVKQSDNTNTAPAGVVQDEYILKVGDSIRVIFHGQYEENSVYDVKSDGRITPKTLNPIPAQGKSLGEVKKLIEAEAMRLHGTSAFVSLESAKQIKIQISGHVFGAGQREMTIYDSVYDAIIAAGGIQKTGSLRHIKLMRGRRLFEIDLYTILTGKTPDEGRESATDLLLQDGDHIIVPPIQNHFAVQGDVPNTGIYELNTDSMDIDSLYALTGFPPFPNATRIILQKQGGNGHYETITLSPDSQIKIHHGDIVTLETRRSEIQNAVEIMGDSPIKGIHSLSKVQTMADLLSDSSNLNESTYPYFAILERYDSTQSIKEKITFSPDSILNKGKNINLQDRDKIIFFSRDSVFEILNHKKESHPYQDLMKDHAVSIQGSVKNAGYYAVADTMTLSQALNAAGGLRFPNQHNSIEVTSRHSGQGHQEGHTGLIRAHYGADDVLSDTVQIGSGDAVQVRSTDTQIQDQYVWINGHVAYPGRYDLMEGDTASSLIERAGGYKQFAYPEGMIFSRESERQNEERTYQKMAQSMDESMARALASPETKDQKSDANNMALAKSLTQELRNTKGLGRIVIKNPQDVLLESGDRLFIPQRPTTVRVYGEVMAASNLAFDKDKSAMDYINEAGGFSAFADKDRAFIVYPDGHAQRLKTSAWNFNPIMIPTGSTIIIPRDPKPYGFIDGTKDITQILSNLAISGIFLDNLQDD